MIKNSDGYKALECFVGTDKTLNMPNGGVKISVDYKLSRYACYLIVQSAEVKNFEKIS